MSSFSSTVALRYLLATRENRFFSWNAGLSVAGVMISVAVMIVVLSVVNGFEKELRRRFLHANAHILAFRYPAGMVDPGQWAKIIAKDFKDTVVGISPFVHYETMVRRGSIMHSVVVRGIDPISRKAVQDVGDMVTPSSALDLLAEEVAAAKAKRPFPALPSAIVGSGVLSLLGIKLGEQIEMISPSESGSGDIQRFKVVGVYDSGLNYYDNRLAVLSLPVAQSFFGMGESVTGLEIGLRDPDISPAVALDMEERYALSIREWQSFNANFFRAMQVERVMIMLIVALVFVVAGFNILTTIFVSVSQKQRDVSILKSLGARDSQIVSIFLKQASLIGVLGGALGIMLALAIAYMLQKYQFIDLPDPYYLKELPVTYDWRVYAGVTLGGVVMCILAGMYPSLVASRVTPSEGFRGNAEIG